MNTARIHGGWQNVLNAAKNHTLRNRVDKAACGPLFLSEYCAAYRQERTDSSRGRGYNRTLTNIKRLLQSFKKLCQSKEDIMKRWLHKFISLPLILLFLSSVKPVFAYAGTDAQPIGPPVTWDDVYTYDLTQPSDLSRLRLSGELAGLEDELASAQDEGVNGLFLLAVIKLESASGTSSLAAGSNNLGGIKNGAGGYRQFGSKSECVGYMGDLLATQYLDPDGRHYHGVTVADVGRAYCSSATWTDKVCALMVALQRQLTVAEDVDAADAAPLTNPPVRPTMTTTQ